MAKSLEQINQEYETSLAQIRQRGRPVKKSKGSAASRAVSNVLFYGAIVFLLISAAAFTMNEDSSRSLIGYRVFQVLSGSMEGVYPKGSMVLVKETEASELEIGDDITFYLNETTTATHRIIGIEEDYEGAGTRGFKTQGVENAKPDTGYVHENNVVGKVTFCVPLLGFILNQVLENIWLVAVMFILVMILSFALRVVFADRKKERGTYAV